MSTPVREPDDRPSKDGPLSYAPKKVRHPGPEPNPAGAPGKDDVAPLRQAPAPHIQAPEPAEPPWKQSEPPPPSTSRKYVLAGRLAGVAMATAVGFIGCGLDGGVSTLAADLARSCG
jgi:hypothetical protein